VSEKRGSCHDGKQPPTFNDYVSKDPVLLFFDPFGRLEGTGEQDYGGYGECGKPVVYLYPTQPTEVHVQFEVPMELTTDIPTYTTGWDVLANPNGQLKDLQPQDTNCSAIDTSAFGSEYAADACKSGIYPYLYWEGRTSNSYPHESDGWIVSKNNLASFMNSTLDSIGFSAQEKSDMVSYWIPEMLKKNMPYYRISFFQTAQMDQFIPMKVTPQPQSVYRLFLDWSPLDKEPSTPLKPETLSHVVRSGFTLVEWGGLKQ
jgi:hypothetical protein